MASRTTTSGDERLMQYFDGELSSEETDVMRAELDGDDDLAARLAGLAHAQDLVRGAFAGAVSDLEDAPAYDADAMFAAITARAGADVADDDPMLPAEVLDESPAEEENAAEEEEDDARVVDAPERPALRVVPGGKPADEVPAEVIHPAEPPSRTGVWLGVAGVLAAAAALFFFLRPPSAVNDPGGDPVAAAPAGSEVEDVDFGYSTGSIFTVDDPEEDAQYAVIWISDEDVVREDPDDDVQPGADGPTVPDGADPDATAQDATAQDATAQDATAQDATAQDATDEEGAPSPE